MVDLTAETKVPTDQAEDEPAPENMEPIPVCKPLREIDPSAGHQVSGQHCIRSLGRIKSGVWIAMIRDELSRLLKARSLFTHGEVLVTNLVLDLEGDRRLLGDPQVQASDLVCVDDKGSSSKSEDSSD